MAEETAPNKHLTIYSPITILRDQVLPDILQEDHDEITYWAGKTVARNYHLGGIKAITTFFTDAKFGTLELIKQNKTEQTWILNGELVAERLAENPEASFGLETGFLAQQTEQQLNCGAEAMWKQEKNDIVITVFTEIAGNLPE